MAITAAMVKELREMTGAGMMDCKKALNEVDGDMEQHLFPMTRNPLLSLKLMLKQTSLLRMKYSSHTLHV